MVHGLRRMADRTRGGAGIGLLVLVPLFAFQAQPVSTPPLSAPHHTGTDQHGSAHHATPGSQRADRDVPHSDGPHSERCPCPDRCTVAHRGTPLPGRGMDATVASIVAFHRPERLAEGRLEWPRPPYFHPPANAPPRASWVIES